MKNLILVMVLKMWMAFVGCTFVEDTEVYTIDDAAVEELDELYSDMDYQEIVSYEKYLDKEEEVEFDLYGIEYENGDVYYTIEFDNNDFDFGICYDENFNVLYYAVSWY